MLKNARITLVATAIGLAGVVLTPVSAHAAVVSLAPPAGNELQFVAHATGTQNYTCQASGAWSKATPEAILVDDDGTPIIHHFGGPTWQDLEDGSMVTGVVVASRPSPDPNAIPWLLLQATPATPGDGRNLSNITYIQRKHTTGGLAPAVPCGAVGTMASVPYTANYSFFAASDDEQ
jgi:hypothetical protein